MSDDASTQLPRHIRGKRPKFFDDPASDHLLSMVLELSAELWVTRSRQSALESYLASLGHVDPKALEAHELTQSEQQGLAAWQSEFMQRLMRTVEAEAKA
ncbi:MAG: hypothetical protein AAF337_04755 [Pseudomonadota bacterium]